MTTKARPFDDQVYLTRCAYLGAEIARALLNEKINTVVDLGCGSGQVGAFFGGLGCEVTYVDGRKEHLEPLEELGRKTLVANVNEPTGLTADLVLCLGLLYHSPNPRRVLETCSLVAPIIAVETLCVDWNAPVCLIEEEKSSRHDQSLNEWGSCHSAAWVEETLAAVGYVHITNISDGIPDIVGNDIHGGFKYQWKPEGSGLRYRDNYGYRRLWVASKYDLR